MRRTALAFGATSMIVGAVFLVINLDDSTPDRTLNDGVYRAGRNEPQTGVKVLRVVDGDTLRVRLHGESVRVRLLGIDAPEVAHNGSGAECFGDEATAELEQLTPIGSVVTLTPDSGQPLVDRYDRLLRYVDRDGTDAGQELLRRGAAERYRNRPPLERDRAYDTAAKRAEREPAGLWETC